MIPDPRVDTHERQLHELARELRTALMRITALEASAALPVWTGEPASGGATGDTATDARPAGPDPAATVWVSTRRAGIPVHRLAGADTSTNALTGCGRATTAGHILSLREARERHTAMWCTRPGCWDGGTS